MARSDTMDAGEDIIMNDIKAIDLPLDEIRRYCAAQPIARLSLFGSALRDELTPESDIDLLVEYLPDAPVSLFKMGGHLMDLTEILGRQAHLSTPYSLGPFLDEVLQHARLIYAAEK